MLILPGGGWAGRQDGWRRCDCRLSRLWPLPGTVVRYRVCAAYRQHSALHTVGKQVSSKVLTIIIELVEQDKKPVVPKVQCVALVPVAETWLEAVVWWGTASNKSKKVDPGSTLGIWQAMIKGCNNTTTHYKAIYQSNTTYRARNSANISLVSARLLSEWGFKVPLHLQEFDHKQWTRGKNK